VRAALVVGNCAIAIDLSNMRTSTSRVRRRNASTIQMLTLLGTSCVSAYNSRIPSRGPLCIPNVRSNYLYPTTLSPSRCAKGRLQSVPWDAVWGDSALPTVVSNVMHSTSILLTKTTTDISSFLPFSELGRELSQSLDIGSNLSKNVGNLPETTTGLVLESLGYDLLVFLAASVFVTPICRSLRITPILGYLIIGALLGPHGLDVFANSKADVELGDFGILFLLFSEGLEVSTPRLRKLANFLPLGYAFYCYCSIYTSWRAI
jgi:Sodium/hydrogen exchanger family